MHLGSHGHDEGLIRVTVAGLGGIRCEDIPSPFSCEGAFGRPRLFSVVVLRAARLTLLRSRVVSGRVALCPEFLPSLSVWTPCLVVGWCTDSIGRGPDLSLFIRLFHSIH